MHFLLYEICHILYLQQGPQEGASGQPPFSFKYRIMGDSVSYIGFIGLVIGLVLTLRNFPGSTLINVVLLTINLKHCCKDFEYSLLESN